MWNQHLTELLVRIEFLSEYYITLASFAINVKKIIFVLHDFVCFCYYSHLKRKLWNNMKYTLRCGNNEKI